MMSDEQKAKVRRVIDEAFHKGNMNAWDEIVAPDVVYHQPPAPDVKGLDAYKKVMEDFRKAFSGLRFTIHEWPMEESVDAFRYTIQGTHTGQLPGSPIPPTGKSVTMTGISMVRTEGGKLVEEWNYLDMLGLMQQLGVAPPVGKAA